MQDEYNSRDEWDSEPDDSLPSHFGRFEVEDILSRDTLNITYLARDPINQELVMVTALADDGRATDRFSKHRRRQREMQAEVSHRLQHPGVLAVIAVSSPDESEYIVHEYVKDAEPLQNYCKPETRLPLHQALSIAYQLATTLDAAHRLGIVHRDIQPRNILVTPDRHAKLRGFALAMLEDVDELTAVVSFGSAVYMSPEQISGEEAAPESDLFSLGVVIYELLTGVHPFMSNVISAIGQKIAKKAHVPLRERRPDAPAVLERILDRALKKHPAGRYQTALDLAGDLGLVLDDVAPKPAEQSDERRLEGLRDLEFFKEFSESEILEIITVSLWLEYEPGERIISDGDPGESFYIVVAGEVSVIKDSVHIETLHRGDCFGEIGFITQGDRTASVEAIDFVTAIEIRARLVERISMTSQIRFQRAFLDIMAARLTRATERIAVLANTPTR